MNKEKIATEYLPLVKSIANKYAHLGVPIEDIIQEGLIGLLEAEKKFDETKGTKLSTYATFWIKKKILESIEKEKKSSLYSVSLDDSVQENKLQTEIKTESKKISIPDNFPNIEKKILQLLFYEEKTLKEIAEILNISRERTRQLKEKALRRLRVTSNQT